MNEELIKELKKVKEKMASQLKDYQEAVEAKNVEVEKNLEKKLEDSFEKVDGLAKKLEDSEKRQKELELTIARGVKDPKTENDPVSNPEVKQAFRSAIAGRPVEEKKSEQALLENIKHFIPGMSEEKAVAHAKAMTVGSDPDGGYYCPVEVANMIITRIFETSPITELANNINTVSKSVNIPIDDDEAGAGWTGEMDDKDETSTPKIGMLEIPTHGMYAYPYLSMEVIEDSTENLDAWIARKAGGKMARLINAACVSGNGVKKPRGFLDYGDWTGSEYTKGKLEHQLTSSAGDIDGDDLIDLHSRMIEEYLANAVWAMNRRVFAHIAKLKDTAGQYLLNQKMLFEGARPQILGHPVRYFAGMPNTVASNGKAVALADFKEGYTIANRVGMTMIRDDVTKKGWIKLFFRMRVGGDVTNYDAIKILKVQ